MMHPEQLYEQTRLIDAAKFPINVFHNTFHGLNGNVMRLHWHEHYELIYFRRGKATFLVNGQAFAMQPGEILFVDSGQLHTGTSDTTGAGEYVAIVFHPSFWGTITEGVPFQTWISANHPIHGALLQAIEGIMTEFARKEEAFEQAVKAYLLLAYAQLKRSHAIVPTREWHASIQLAERFKPLIEHLQMHYAEPISVKEAAGGVNFSEYHFCKCFKKATGRTFVEYLQHIRVEEAERLLLRSTASITEIAEQTGFGNINYFDRVFRKFKGFPPSQVRKSQQNN
jgi:AraC family transcriptional activator of pobA